MASKEFEIIEQPIFTRRKLRMVGVGAGFANLTLAYKHKYGGDNDYIDFVIYEKNSGIGGTWYENRYPGVAVDVPAHIYCFPFAPNPDWSHFYVTGKEILDYMNKTVDEYKLRDCVRVDSKVVSAIWSDELGKWQLTIEQNGRTIQDEADILVNGSGFLNKWQFPDVEGIEKYKGQIVHSAHWQDIDWAGKRVGLIGNGSSAIQILPQLQETAKSIDTYIRTPTWIIPNMLVEFTPEGKNFAYSEADKQRFREHPEELREMRQKFEHVFNQFFALFMKDAPQQAAVRTLFADMMRQRLGDTELADKLIPDWPVGCRRITPGEGYLEALVADNVKVRFESILRFDEKGIVSQAPDAAEPEATEFDIVVCATGFEVSCKPGWTMKGHNGADLHELWREESEGFMGIWAPEQPNYFCFAGPNSPVGHGSIFGVLDAISDYILKWCNKIASEGIKSVTVKPDVMEEHNEYTQKFLQRTVWSSGCRSWYKNHTTDGKVQAMYAGSVLHFRGLLQAFRTEDFDMVYWNKHNRFGFLGNGMTKLEQEGGQLGYYLEK